MAYECQQFLQPGERLCKTEHCTTYSKSSAWTRFCLCMVGNQKLPHCTVKDASTPTPLNLCYNTKTGAEELITKDECKKKIKVDDNWEWSECFCCCSCFAWDTKIAVSANELRFIQTLEEGGNVYAGSLKRKNNKLELHWETRPILMSSGTGPGGSQEMIAVQYGEDGEIIVTHDHVFLLASGRLIRADRLMPKMHLMGDDGKPVAISHVRAGNYIGGIHHISISDHSKEISGIDGHLISSNGVVTGDFTLQVMQSAPPVAALMIENHDALPQIGTQAYLDAAGAHATLFSAQAEESKAKPIRSPLFEPHIEFALPRGVPKWAPRFLSDEQARQIKDAPHVPVGIELNRANFRYLKQLLSAFYPNVNLHLEWADETPNLYAFRQFGQDTVYISGRLLRTLCIKRDALAFILAHGIARLMGKTVTDKQGCDCTASADFDAASFVMLEAFYFNWSKMVNNAYDQIEELFKLTTFWEPGCDICIQPGLKCRLDAIDAAMSGRNLPICAGGPTPGALRLISAKASLIEGAPTVVATFNLPLQVESALRVDNYIIMPETVITTVLIGPGESNVVYLTLTLPEDPKGEFVLYVDDIVSQNGSSLNAEAKSVPFTIGAEIKSGRN